MKSRKLPPYILIEERKNKLGGAKLIMKKEIYGLKINQAHNFSNMKNSCVKKLCAKHRKKKDLAVIRFNSTISSGLNQRQVDSRVKNGLVNNTNVQTSKSYLSIFVKNIFTFFNMLWLLIAVALCIVQSFPDLFFLLVVVINTAIAIIQEIRAKITVEKLSLQTLPHVKTIRESQDVDVTSTSLVLDDIIVLSNGCQIPSDCIILDGKVEVNESMLTGESNAIVKKSGDRLFSGSFIISGKCYARVDKVGKDNYMYQIATKAREFKAPLSNLFKDINRLIKYISIILVPIGILTAIKEYFNASAELSGAFEIAQRVVTKTAGAITAMIPAGMFLLVTISLAVGVVKLAKKKTLVRDVYSIEMLSRTNVLCLDKTGTITDGTMTVVGYKTFQDKKDVKNIISSILFNQQTANSTSNALIAKFGIADSVKALNTIEFSSARKYSVTELEKDNIYFLGAVSFIGATLSDEQKEYIANSSSKGLRVVALCKKQCPFSEKVDGSGAQVLALITLEETIRKDAIETINWFKNNGVSVKIISGDDPATVSKIAARVGVENSDKYLSLEGLSLTEIEQIADKFTVFGRVTPEQKYTLIKALKANGNVVSMIGDGVNDTLALKEADCSIAMADGSEVARNISKIVLLDSNFSSVPSVVREGRQVVNNVQNSSSLFLMKTIFAVLLTLSTLVFNLDYPFIPRMMFLLELFVIGIPSFILTFEPNTNQIKGNFIPLVMKRALPRALLLYIPIFILVVLNERQVLPLLPEEFQTLLVLVLSYLGFINLAALCFARLSPVKWSAMGVSIVGLVLANIIMPDFFGMIILSSPVLITFASIIGGAALLVLLIMLSSPWLEKLKDKICLMAKKK